jgi:hypothetical protein
MSIAEAAQVNDQIRLRFIQLGVRIYQAFHKFVTMSHYVTISERSATKPGKRSVAAYLGYVTKVTKHSTGH